jgi:hypothetical protein
MERKKIPIGLEVCAFANTDALLLDTELVRTWHGCLTAAVSLDTMLPV